MTCEIFRNEIFRNTVNWAELCIEYYALCIKLSI